jgi:hypothetical protein
MAATTSLRRRLALLPVVAVLLAGCFGDDVGGESGWRPPESAQAWDVPVQEVLERMQRRGLDCTVLWLAELPPRNTRRAGVCRLAGELVEVVTFGDQEQRFAFLTSHRGEEGYIVAGEKWAVGLRDRRVAQRVQRALGGEIEHGIIGIPS